MTKKKWLDVSFCVVRDNLGVGGQEWKEKWWAMVIYPTFGRQDQCLPFQICQQHRSATNARYAAHTTAPQPFLSIRCHIGSAFANDRRIV